MSLDRALQAGAQPIGRSQAAARRACSTTTRRRAVKRRRHVALPDVAEWADRERLANEKEVLGFYLPAIRWPSIAKALATYCSHTTTGLAGVPQRTEVMLGGMLSSIKFSHTKNPRPGSTNTKYAMFDLEDMDGIVRCIVWPEEFARVRPVGPGRRDARRARHDRPPRRQRRSESDRQRTDSAR